MAKEDFADAEQEIHAAYKHMMTAHQQMLGAQQRLQAEKTRIHNGKHPHARSLLSPSNRIDVWRLWISSGSFALLFVGFVSPIPALGAEWQEGPVDK